MKWFVSYAALNACVSWSLEDAIKFQRVGSHFCLEVSLVKFRRIFKHTVMLIVWVLQSCAISKRYNFPIVCKNWTPCLHGMQVHPFATPFWNALLDIMQTHWCYLCNADLPLRHLDLTSMLQITDEATKSIASMVSLRYLSLSGTRVTDEGVARLAGMVKFGY